MEYSMGLKALEPQRWWHKLGVKRKMIDLGIKFNVCHAKGMEFKCEQDVSFSIDDISIKAEKDFVGEVNFPGVGSELVTNTPFDEGDWTKEGNDWSKSNDGWTVDKPMVTVEEIGLLEDI